MEIVVDVVEIDKTCIKIFCWLIGRKTCRIFVCVSSPIPLQVSNILAGYVTGKHEILHGRNFWKFRG